MKPWNRDNSTVVIALWADDGWRGRDMCYFRDDENCVQNAVWRPKGTIREPLCRFIIKK